MAGCMYQNYGHSKLLPFLTTYSATDVSGVVAEQATHCSNPCHLKQVVIEQITEVMSNIWAVMIAGAALNVLLGLLLGASNPFARRCLPPGDRALLTYI